MKDRLPPHAWFSGVSVTARELGSARMSIRWMACGLCLSDKLSVLHQSHVILPNPPQLIKDEHAHPSALA